MGSIARFLKVYRRARKYGFGIVDAIRAAKANS
jgi:hypothetical protein